MIAIMIMIRHRSLNDLLWRAMTKADIPALKACLELMVSDLTVSCCCRGNKESAPSGTSQSHSEQHTSSVIRARDVPDSRRSSRGGTRKEKKQVFLTKPVVLISSNRDRNSGGNQQGQDGLPERRWEARHTKHRWPPRESLPLLATLRFNSTPQCGRCHGYLHPHNPRGQNVAVPAFVLFFSLVFSPRDLYYRGKKIIIINLSAAVMELIRSKQECLKILPKNTTR